MKVVIFFVFLAIVINAQGKNMIEIPAIFSSNMVLQQNSEANFWGIAKANLKVNATGKLGSTVNTVC